MTESTIAYKASRKRNAGRKPASGSREPLPATDAPVRRKYNNVVTEVDGLRFDSKREAERYISLRDDVQRGAIRDLEVHPRFPLVVRGENCGDYVGDFAYIGSDGSRHVEDVKSAATRKLPTYRLKARLVWALYGLRIEER